jgi:hypothetical protein
VCALGVGGFTFLRVFEGVNARAVCDCRTACVSIIQVSIFALKSTAQESLGVGCAHAPGGEDTKMTRLRECVTHFPPDWGPFHS